MTREEAIRCLSVHSSTNGSGLCTDKQHYEAKQMAIKALSQQTEDAISRQAAVNIASGFCHPANIADELAKLPSVNPQEPKTGHWKTEDMFDGDVAYRCSECDELFWIESGTPKDNEYNFCPKCGAKMAEAQESEEV